MSEQRVRAQLVQCTTAMREACTRLKNANLADAGEVIRMVNELVNLLDFARSSPVPLTATQVVSQLEAKCRDQADTIDVEVRNRIQAQTECARLQAR